MKEFNIIETETKGHEMQLAFLEGVIMANGEFIFNGRSVFLNDADKVYLLKK